MTDATAIRPETPVLYDIWGQHGNEARRTLGILVLFDGNEDFGASVHVHYRVLGSPDWTPLFPPCDIDHRKEQYWGETSALDLDPDIHYEVRIEIADERAVDKDHVWLMTTWDAIAETTTRAIGQGA